MATKNGDSMKETVKGAVKSKTIWLSGALATLFPVLEIFPEMKVFLGDYYGPALILLSATVALLRYLTTTALDKK